MVSFLVRVLVADNVSRRRRHGRIVLSSILPCLFANPPPSAIGAFLIVRHQNFLNFSSAFCLGIDCTGCINNVNFEASVHIYDKRSGRVGEHETYSLSVKGTAGLEKLNLLVVSKATLAITCEVCRFADGDIRRVKVHEVPRPCVLCYVLKQPLLNNCL